MNRRTRFKLGLYLVLLIISISLLVWFWVYNVAKIRDLERLADMRTTQAYFNIYFYHHNTYVLDQCSVNTPINFCGLNSALIDPVNNGVFQYIVKDLSLENYRIDFALEVGVAGLTPGIYSLDKEGIKRPVLQ